MSKIYIQHRVNQSQLLKGIDKSYGCEVDLRTTVGQKGAIHLSHDPWTPAEDFREWLKVFVSEKIGGPLILNTKEDGLETRTLELLKEFGIQNYFFLDTALPTLVRWTQREGNKNFALRLSIHEPASALETFKGKADWLWVDCFGAVAIEAATVSSLKKSFKVCLVSPELQGAPLETIQNFKELYRLADAICTKSPQTWIKNFEN